MLEQSTDIAERGILNLAPPFWGKPRIAAILKSWLDEMQALENAIFDVLNKRLLDNAISAQLDVLGKIVGQPRGTSDDTLYRGLIRIRIQVNRSLGEASDVYAFLRDFSTLVFGHADFVYTEPSTATIVARFQDTFAVFSPLFADLARAVRPGGINFQIVRPLTNAPSSGKTVFRYRDSAATGTAAAGYGSAGGTLRGYYSDVTVY